MLRNSFQKELTATKLLKSDILNRARKELGDRTFDSMVKRYLNFVEERAENAINKGISSFTLFGLVLGDNGLMCKKDYDYLWEKAILVFGDTDYAKRFLGTLQMYAFALSEHNWVYVEDTEKRAKLENGETPQANKFFLDQTKKPTFEDSLNALKNKWRVV